MLFGKKWPFKNLLPYYYYYSTVLIIIIIIEGLSLLQTLLF